MLDDIDTCFTQQIDSMYPVDEFGCRPTDEPPEITQVKLYGVEDGVWDNVIDLFGQSLITILMILTLGLK